MELLEKNSSNISCKPNVNNNSVIDLLKSILEEKNKQFVGMRYVLISSVTIINILTIGT